MYLNYEQYMQMGGTLEETAFRDLEMQARNLIKRRTFNRLKDQPIPQEVQECVYAMVSIIDAKQKAFTLGQDLEGNTTASIASQSNDGVSISYNTMSAAQLFDISKDELSKTIETYLEGVTDGLGRKLLYRGLYAGE